MLKGEDLVLMFAMTLIKSLRTTFGASLAMRLALGVSLTMLLASGCVMEPAYLGYEVDLEDESETTGENSADLGTSDIPDDSFPEDPDFDLTRRQCRKLGRRYYSECRENCDRDDPGCKERCEREARDFVRACLKNAKPDSGPQGPGSTEDASVFEKSKDFLKSEGEPHA